VLCCKVCYNEVPDGQGDGSERRPVKSTNARGIAMITDDDGITMTELAYSVLNDKCEGFDPGGGAWEEAPSDVGAVRLIRPGGYAYVGTVGVMAGERYYLHPEAHRMRQQLRERYLARISQGLPPHD